MRTQEQEESREIHIARDVLNARRREGDFLLYLMRAFVWADTQNFEVLKPVIQEMVEKYDLKCTCEPGSPDALPSGKLQATEALD